MVKDLSDIFLDGEERKVVDKHRDCIVVIDPRPIKTIDFDLTDIEQAYLMAEGRACALEFLLARNFEGGPKPHDVTQAQVHADALWQEVKGLRRHRSRIRTGMALAACLLVGGGLWWFMSRKP